MLFRGRSSVGNFSSHQPHSCILQQHIYIYLFMICFIVYVFIKKGLIWIELRKGAHLFEVGDHGGVVVMVPYPDPTNVRIIISYFCTLWTTVKAGKSSSSVSKKSRLTKLKWTRTSQARLFFYLE